MDVVQETVNSYNSFAEEYKLRYQNDKDENKMKKALDKFIKLIGINKKVLDVGSGAGFDSKYLSESGLCVTGIDLAEKLLEIASQFAPNVQFLKMDMRSLNFPAENFEGVWASASLLHLPKSEIVPVISNIYNLLKNNSIFYLALKQGVGEDFVVNKGVGNLDGAKRYFSYYEKNEIVDILEKTGFKVIDYFTDTNRNNIWMNIFCKKSI